MTYDSTTEGPLDPRLFAHSFRASFRTNGAIVAQPRFVTLSLLLSVLVVFGSAVITVMPMHHLAAEGLVHASTLVILAFLITGFLFWTLLCSPHTSTHRIKMKSPIYNGPVCSRLDQVKPVIVAEHKKWRFDRSAIDAGFGARR